jgi:hypothetical protein
MVSATINSFTQFTTPSQPSGRVRGNRNFEQIP